MAKSKSRNVPDNVGHVASVIAAFLTDCFDDPAVKVTKVSLREIWITRVDDKAGGRQRYFTVKVSETV